MGGAGGGKESRDSVMKDNGGLGSLGTIGPYHRDWRRLFLLIFFLGGGISVPVETKWKSYLKVQRRETEFVSSRRVINARFDPPYTQKKGVGGCSREPTGEPVHHTICKPLQRPLLSSPGRPLSRP